MYFEIQQTIGKIQGISQSLFNKR